MASASSLLHLHLPSLAGNFLFPRLCSLRARSYVRSAVDGDVSVIDPLPSPSDSPNLERLIALSLASEPQAKTGLSSKTYGLNGWYAIISFYTIGHFHYKDAWCLSGPSTIHKRVFQRMDVFSKGFDNIVELELGAPWPLPPVEVTVTLAHTFEITEKLRSRSQIAPQTRRHLVGVSLLAILTLKPCPVWAQEKEEEEENEGVIGAIKSLFDPDEKTKSGKVLPKAYLKSAREVVKTLRESLEEDPKDNAKFRRTADAAKGPIRDYLSNWRGQQKVASEESYAIFEKVIRSLAGFYSKAGPSAPLPQDLKSQILDYLNKAEEFL